MRVAQAAGYDEPRDCLAQDWTRFMAAVLPGVRWVPIPNVGADVATFLRDWNLDGFILTGGNDIGECALRDETERTLLQEAVERQLPVFGVCRGLQFIQSFFGGALRRCPREEHVNVRHLVRVTPEPGHWGRPLELHEVNSFHGWGVPVADLAEPLSAFAATADSWAEGIVHREFPITAVQWHPERMNPFEGLDRRLVQDLFLHAA